MFLREKTVMGGSKTSVPGLPDKWLEQAREWEKEVKLVDAKTLRERLMCWFIALFLGLIIWLLVMEHQKNAAEKLKKSRKDISALASDLPTKQSPLSVTTAADNSTTSESAWSIEVGDKWEAWDPTDVFFENPPPDVCLGDDKSVEAKIAFTDKAWKDTKIAFEKWKREQNKRE